MPVSRYCIERQKPFPGFSTDLESQKLLSSQTLWKIISSYWKEAIFRVSEPESKNLMSHEKNLTFSVF